MNREPRSWCSVLLPHVIYAGPQTKEDFDRIALPASVHDWRPDPTEGLLRGDGQSYEHRCHSKLLSTGAIGGTEVIFQWFEYRVAETKPTTEVAT